LAKFLLQRFILTLKTICWKKKLIVLRHIYQSIDFAIIATQETCLHWLEIEPSLLMKKVRKKQRKRKRENVMQREIK
jgi:hypothetical protein